MRAQEILTKYENVKNIKKLKLSELKTLIKNDLFDEIRAKIDSNTKIDNNEILDIDLSEKIFNNKNIFKQLHLYFKIQLNFRENRAKELLSECPYYIKCFASPLQVAFKDWILDNFFQKGQLLISTSYLCKELKCDFDFLEKFISKIYESRGHCWGFFLSDFKPNKNTNQQLITLVTKYGKLTKAEQKRFSNNVIIDGDKEYNIKDFLSDIEKYKKELLNKGELKAKYIKLFLEQLQELSDDEIKSFLLAFATKPKTFNVLLKNYDFCIRLAKLDELLSCIVLSTEIEKLSFSKEQINNLIKLNPKYEKLAKNYEKLIISFSNDASKILEINSLIDDESISELINLAYTKELECNYLHLSRSIENKEFISKHSETYLIINDSLNTATLVKYNDTSKTTEKLVYSFKKAAV